MSETQGYGVFDDLPEPGVFSGVMTLLGAALGIVLITYAYLYGASDGPVASAHIGFVIGVGLLFSFLCAALTFLIGWAIELTWPLLLLIVLVGALLVLPLYFYTGGNVVSFFL